MQDLVPVDLARAVAAHFYRRLFEHGQVDRALNEARSLVYERGAFAWAVLVLFLRLRDGRLFSKPEAAHARRRLQAPRPPDYFAGRVDEINRLRAHLMAQPDAAVTIAIQGVGGQGKSALAKKIGQQLDPHFPGGVLWVDVDQGADPAGRRADIVNRIALGLALPLQDELLPAKREAIVRAELGRQGRLLAILDDVWEVDAGRWHRESVLPDGAVVLVTSRDLGVCQALASYVEPLCGLSVPDGLRLLANLLGELGQHEDRARELVILLDGHALALAFYEQALLLQRQVGDKAGETVTCYNMAMIYATSGDLRRAERLLMRTVELDEATGHPDLESDRATLRHVRSKLQGQSTPAGGPEPGEAQ